MPNSDINNLTAVASVEAADEFEVQPSGSATTKKATLSQLTQVEATARAATDDAIIFSTGLESDGTYSSLENSYYMRIVDHASIIDRSGVVEDLPLSIHSALRLLDAKLKELHDIVDAL